MSPLLLWSAFPAHKDFLTHFSFHTYSPCNGVQAWLLLSAAEETNLLTQDHPESSGWGPARSLWSPWPVVLSRAQRHLASPQRVLRIFPWHRHGTPVGVMRFLENRLTTEMEERLGMAETFGTSASLVVFWVVIPDHQATYSPSWSWHTSWGLDKSD